MVLFCSCGSSSILARGLCARCYAANRHDRKRFGGLRERAIVRDGRRCTGCGSEHLIVHHRRRGRGRDLCRLATLCPIWLLELWREQHPGLAEHSNRNDDFRL
jgi:hypothetical protein